MRRYLLDIWSRSLHPLVAAAWEDRTTKPVQASMRIAEEARSAAHEDAAEVIILVCATGDTASQRQEKLGVPVIDLSSLGLR